MSVRSTRRGPSRALAEKLQIVAEYEALPHGRRAEVLRRYGVSGSSVRRWAYARDHGEFGTGRTGRRPNYGVTMTPKKQSAEILRLRRELAKAQADQEILKAALETTGKVHALLEKLAESAEREPLNEAFEKKPPNDSSQTD